MHDERDNKPENAPDPNEKQAPHHTPDTGPDPDESTTRSDPPPPRHQAPKPVTEIGDSQSVTQDLTHDPSARTTDASRHAATSAQTSDHPSASRASQGSRSRSVFGSASRTGRTTTRSKDPSHDARFSAGDTLAGRYRIVAFLGKGGMGEVYRADDLELAQSVALKLLPTRISTDPALADRVRAEVRLARGITHRNVCRIHDIARLPAEQGGDMFITMEFVDGEDLASLLRRIGKLPQDKAIDVARQLCAALAAAHDQGVIHRDLKPANVMLDGRGNARLTDFGIAAIDDELDERDASSGTPAYMSPEQFKGESVSKKSDIYSLGLVIFELLTGRPAWKADSLAELRSLREDTRSPISLTTVSRSDIDPALAALVERCTETDPDERPASALAVAAALPGADPLAAAIAAGETPSPELIAASGGRGALSPRLAATFAAIAVALALAAAWLASTSSLLTAAGAPPPPAVMREEALEAVRTLGYNDPDDWPTQHGWLVHSFSLNRVSTAVRAGDADWSALREGINTPIRYWLRRDPAGFETREPSNKVWTEYPIARNPGALLVQLDQNRKLRKFTRQPNGTDPDPDNTEADWAAAFQLAGLDFAAFTPVDAVNTPGTDPIVQRAWDGPAPPDPLETDPITLRVYAGARDGLITDFEITLAPEGPAPSLTNTPNTDPPADPQPAEDLQQPAEQAQPPAALPLKTIDDSAEQADPAPQPTDQPTDQPEAQSTDQSESPTDPAASTTPTTSPQGDAPTTQTAVVESPPTEPGPNALLRALQAASQWILIGTITGVAALLAYRNIRLHRADTRRAVRLGVTMFLLAGASTIIDADIPPLSLTRLLGPFPIYSAGIGFAFIAAACYIAAEPLARSRWPRALVAWTRLFSGQFRDPMVGRDLLIGILVGTVILFLGALAPVITDALGHPPRPPSSQGVIQTLQGPRHVIALCLGQITSALLNAAAIALLVLLTMILLGFLRIRQTWPAILIVTLLVIAQQFTQTQLSIADRVFALLSNLIVLVLIGRVGLLATAAALATASCLTYINAATPLGEWWTPAAITPAILVAAVLAYAYRTATAGRSLFDYA